MYLASYYSPLTLKQDFAEPFLYETSFIAGINVCLLGTLKYYFRIVENPNRLKNNGLPFFLQMETGTQSIEMIQLSYGSDSKVSWL